MLGPRLVSRLFVPEKRVSSDPDPWNMRASKAAKQALVAIPGDCHGWPRLATGE